MTASYDGGADIDYCLAWDSVFAALGHMECRNADNTCTKVAATHEAKMGLDVGVLKMKRLTCNTSGQCMVYKAGRCFKVNQTVFKRIHGEVESGGQMGPDALVQASKRFAELVVSDLRRGTAQDCTGSDAERGKMSILAW